ncbi:MAG: type III pantothenate kinase [Pirellulales bacterium]
MNNQQPKSFIAVDIGNTTISLALFHLDTGQQLPTPASPASHIALDTIQPQFELLEQWLTDLEISPSVKWFVISVNQPGLQRLQDWHSADEKFCVLSAKDFPLSISVGSPEKVGMDRIAAAVAANCLRDKQHAAIVVDAGSAVTIDAVDAEGKFIGGAILPGLKMLAASLSGQTDLLPLIQINPEQPPQVVGRDTGAAIRSGCYWGSVGAIQYLVQRMEDQFSEQVDLFISGGDASKIAAQGNRSMQTVPHLVLSGIAVAVESLSKS